MTHYKNTYPYTPRVAYYDRGTWTPTKNDSLAKRVSGFGATMNVLYGDLICGHGDNESMNNIISHYLH